MKAGIHPEYKLATVTCGCGNYRRSHFCYADSQDSRCNSFHQDCHSNGRSAVPTNGLHDFCDHSPNNKRVDDSNINYRNSQLQFRSHNTAGSNDTKADTCASCTANNAQSSFVFSFNSWRQQLSGTCQRV